MRRLAFLPILAILAACTDSTDPEPVPPGFAVTPAMQWAGGELRVRSTYFRGLTDLPEVTAAGEPMAVTRLDDSTVAATLPGLVSQEAEIAVAVGETTQIVDTVRVVGFSTHWVTNPTAFGNPVLVHSTGGPFGIAGVFPQPTMGATALVALDQRITQSVSGVTPVDWGMLRAVGATYDSSRYILRDSSGTIAEWRLIPGPTLVDTVPSFLQSPFARITFRLSETVWVNTHNHTTDVIRTGLPTYAVSIEDPYRITMSGAADRAILSGGYPAAGAVVFRMSTGDTAYRVPIHPVSGAAFTADGGTLFVANGLYSATHRIMAFDAADGGLLDQVVLPAEASNVLGLALAGGGSRLLLAYQEGSIPVVLVYDAASLSLLGRLPAPPETATNVAGWLDADIIADDATRTAYVMGAGGYIWEFDLMP